MKRIFPIVTAMIMAFCLLATNALAADTPAHTHTYGDAIYETTPTCRTEGVKVFKCIDENCDLSDAYKIMILPTVDHQAAEGLYGQKDAGCLQEGYTGDVVCKWCMTVLAKGEATPKVPHTPGDWVVDVVNSNDELQVRYQPCTQCKLIIAAEVNHQKPEDVPHVHDFTITLTDIAPTCRTEGLRVAVCTAQGECDLEGRLQTTALPAAPHTPAADRIGASDASCLLEGSTGTQICKDCLTVLEEAAVIPKTEHTPGDWIKDTLRSSDTLTVEHRFCTSCKLYLETRETPVVHIPNEIPFTDVPEDAYYRAAVEWAAENGITGGTSATTFSPTVSCTRGQVVTFLWRSAGSPEPRLSSNPFTDVTEDAYYYKAVLWAVENGITSGTTATTFSPEEPCTRAQVVTFLWRAEGSPDCKLGVNSFLDVGRKDYFYHPVIWAKYNDITGGTALFMFSPNQPCTRAQIVTFLYKASQI